VGADPAKPATIGASASRNEVPRIYLTQTQGNGDIMGYGTDEFGYHAIRWTHVVPESSSMLALGVGVPLAVLYLKSGLAQNRPHRITRLIEVSRRIVFRKL